ncbi:hypothetical protein ZIOFF_043663 [Zingiber officinale]|uniref:Uncharacterized protein n=1 Tax=Zingiber officinale TaxID=94328 RepID=A0A8J5KU39_ZINOF|nr:hypothetical protein ZIOFF_043663 [Zingiber officinale]
MVPSTVKSSPLALPHSGRSLCFTRLMEGGLDESNLSDEEKLRQERSRERGLGVTRYEWKSRSTSSSCSAPGKPTIVVPLPNGVYFQEISGSEPELKLTCCAGSPIIDPHLSPDGSMLAYVKDDELHVLNPSSGEPKQLTFGATANRKLPSRKLNNRWKRSLEPVGILMYTTPPPQVIWGVSEQQHNKKVEATIEEDLYNEMYDLGKFEQYYHQILKEQIGLPVHRDENADKMMCIDIKQELKNQKKHAKSLKKKTVA